SRDYFSADKSRNQFTVTNPAWIPDAQGRRVPEIIASDPGALRVRVRHGPEMQACTITPLDDGSASEATTFRVELTQNDQGLAAGQFAVFYSGSYCLGCAVISESQSAQVHAGLHGDPDRGLKGQESA